MVAASAKSYRRHLLNKYPLVPYAGDGPKTRDALARIHSEMATLLMLPEGATDCTPEQYAEVDKRRPQWARELQALRYQERHQERS